MEHRSEVMGMQDGAQMSRAQVLLSHISDLLDDLAAVPVSDGAQLAEEIVLITEVREALDIALLARVHAFDTQDLAAGTGSESTAAWVSTQARIDPAESASLVRLAGRLHGGELDATRAALTAGHLTRHHAQVISTSTAVLAPTDRAGAEALLVHAARTLTPSALRDLAASHRVALCQEPDRARRWQQQHDTRGFTLHDLDPHGLSRPGGQLTAELTATLRTIFDAFGHRTGSDDTRSRTQRHHDALHEALTRVLHAGSAGERGGVRPHLNITIDLHDLLSDCGGSAQLDRLHGSRGQRQGAINPTTAQRLACDAEATLTLVNPQQPDHPALPDPASATALLDPHVLRKLHDALPPALGGTILEILAHGRTKRTVTPAQRRALNLRDKGCVIAGCTAHWTRCEAHHSTPWHRGGSTDLPNLILLCPRHHHLAHEGGHQPAHDHHGRWRLRPPPPTRRDHAA
jgi:hypothetical protein